MESLKLEDKVFCLKNGHHRLCNKLAIKQHRLQRQDLEFHSEGESHVDNIVGVEMNHTLDGPAAGLENSIAVILEDLNCTM